MKLHWILVAACLFAAPAVAGAKKYGKQVRYAGIHPVSKHDGGGICHIEAPHVHIYPANKLEYRVHADNHVFIGDPVAYGWDGPKYAYKGHHPVQVNVVAGVGEPYTHYCYLDGAHYHAWDAEGPEFKIVGDAHFYVGKPAPLYLEAKPTYVAINATYRPIVYTRPVIEVEPPAGWIGISIAPAVIVETPPPVVVAPRGRAHVGGGIGVHVDIPVPSVNIHVGGPAVIVKGRGHVHQGKHKKFKHKKHKRH
jgi:hypothetical protein